MKQIEKALLLVVLALTPLLLLAAQVSGAAPQPNGTPPQTPGAVSQPAPAPASNPAALRILSPHQGERLEQDFVSVRYELTNSGASAASTPTFQLQLDGKDAVTTSSTEYTFTGLAPGAHKITVQLVDANETPIPGATNQVQFFIVQPATGLRREARVVAAALRVEDPQQPMKDIEGHELPSAGGALPLLSVIGFGALLGGIASALKTR